MRVLIAEDEALIRMDLREMLDEEGHEVVGEARDGAEAIELARSLRARRRVHGHQHAWRRAASRRPRLSATSASRRS